MKGLREKFRKNEGFTLVEMLIVVAIIAILIAVSIPLVGNALENARVATDDANERAAKAETLIIFMGAADVPTGVFPATWKPGQAITATSSADSGKVYYDAETGGLSKTKPTDGYGKCSSHAGQVIYVTMTAEGVFTPNWE